MRVLASLSAIQGCGGLRAPINAAALLFLVCPAIASEPIIGQASVIDGDTIEIHGTRIRLEGIDAPESGQRCIGKASGAEIRCGQRAAFFLADMIGRHVVSCMESGKDRYKRTLARCEVGGQDVGAAMVKSGWAMAYVRYSSEYIPQEAEARTAELGIWATEFVPPWDWRRGAR
ncbi:thermonuclease family protein [Xanthobacter sediminis]|uniref:thermonuclease family protein n=1 Tax=Xanthobacter sediminis TaxID=3119926 RepID=UPI00372C162F